MFWAILTIEWAKPKAAVSRNWSARPVLPTLGLTQWWTKNGPRGGRGPNPARAVDFQHNHLMFHVKKISFFVFLGYLKLS